MLKEDMCPLSTNDLQNRLNSADSAADLDEYMNLLADSEEKLSFPDYIAGRLKACGISEAELIRRSLIQRNYGYQILSGVRRPGRDKVIALCLALSLNLDETQKALRCAGETMLYAKSQRDSILIFCVNKNMSVQETNELLDSHGKAIL